MGEGEVNCQCRDRLLAKIIFALSNTATITENQYNQRKTPM
jgi:hypothetical protein